MSLDQWSAVDHYFNDHLIPPDDVLDATLAASAAANLPSIQVSPSQGRLLRLIVSIHGARTILEIGTLGGYSTICLARGMADGGRVTTLEIDPAHADVARANFARAGLTDTIDLRLGPALDTLPTLAGPFDLIFIDADKVNNPDYFQWAMRLSRPGTVIIVDNVVRNGRVIESSDNDAVINGTRRVVELIGKESRVTATATQTVGEKGYDGFILATVNQ
ncbi:MAG TPA: O-methyltransferase [Pseudonocardiaceae bacterium]